MIAIILYFLRSSHVKFKFTICYLWYLNRWLLIKAHNWRWKNPHPSFSFINTYLCSSFPYQTSDYLVCLLLSPKEGGFFGFCKSYFFLVSSSSVFSNIISLTQPTYPCSRCVTMNWRWSYDKMKFVSQHLSCKSSFYLSKLAMNYHTTQGGWSHELLGSLPLIPLHQEVRLQGRSFAPMYFHLQLDS